MVSILLYVYLFIKRKFVTFLESGFLAVSVGTAVTTLFNLYMFVILGFMWYFTYNNTRRDKHKGKSVQSVSPTQVSKIHFNIIIPSTSGSSKFSPPKLSMHVSSLP
jgi:hypothetical protein